MIINIPVEICREGIEIPQYAKLNDAGMDIRAAEDAYIHPNQTIIIPTGIKVAIPIGYEIEVRPRSGLSNNTPLRIANSPGTVDSGFRDEIGIIITNTSESYLNNDYIHNLNTKGNKQGIYQINKGDRIAQIVLKEVPTINWVIVDSVKDIGIDRKSGFGDTGIK